MSAEPVVPQHLQALALANAVRLSGAELKRELCNGQLSLAAALEDERAARLTVMALLCAQHRWGTSRAGALLKELKISEMKRVGSLTANQRASITAAVPVPPGQRRARRVSARGRQQHRPPQVPLPATGLSDDELSVLCWMNTSEWQTAPRLAALLGRDDVPAVLSRGVRRGMLECTPGRLAMGNEFAYRLTRKGAREVRDALR